MTDLKEFVEKMNKAGLVPTIINDEAGNEYLHFHDGKLQLLNRDDLKLIVEELSKTLKLGKELDEHVNENNTYYQFATSPNYKRSEYDHNKFSIPFDRLRVREKFFDPTKRVWSFKCGNCSRKVVSDSNEKYYSISPDETVFYSSKSVRACSIGCAKVIAKDIVQDWLYDHKQKDYFYTKNLSKQTDDFFKANF